jgi:hypothetical protein
MGDFKPKIYRMLSKLSRRLSSWALQLLLDGHRSIDTPVHTVGDPHSQDLHISVRLISQ